MTGIVLIGDFYIELLITWNYSAVRVKALGKSLDDYIIIALLCNHIDFHF